MSPTLDGTSALQRFECGNTFKIRIRIMFDFYLGRPHVVIDSDIQYDCQTISSLVPRPPWRVVGGGGLGLRPSDDTMRDGLA